MKLIILFLILFHQTAILYSQTLYEFENPRRKYDKIELEFLVKANVKQRNTYVTLFDKSGNVTQPKELRYINKYNQTGTIVIGEQPIADGIRRIQMTEYKTDEILVTDLTKDLNDKVIDSSTIKKDKYGKLIRTDIIKKWSIDTINSKVIAYRCTKVKLNGEKGYSDLYYVNIDNDSLISQDFDPSGKMTGFNNYYFDSKDNVVKEIRTLGTFMYKYDENNNDVELLEYNNNKLIKRIEKIYNNNNLISQKKIFDSDNNLIQIAQYEYEYF